ncbi:hypothetical protein Pelo_6654 [Pelomyxa schiedti]|nr:hypothetical protein Pelo_6654 [Pelomyxa schiedti]
MSTCPWKMTACMDEMQGATGRIPTVEPQGDVYLTKIDALNHEAFVFWHEEGNSESWEFLKKTLRLTILPQRQKSVTRTEKKFDYGDVSIIDVGSEECTHVDISKVPFVIASIRCARMDAPYKYTSTKSVSTGVEKEARECAKQLDCPFIQVDISDRAKTLNTFKLLFKEAQRLGFTKSGKMADCNVSWELEHIIKD